MERTTKDYEQWSIQLQQLNNKKKTPNVELGEVRRYYVGINVGNEISKGYNEEKGLKGSFKRTGIVLHELSNRLVVIAPITTKQSRFSRKHGIKLKDYVCDAWVLPDQVHLADKRRLQNAVFDKNEKKEVKYGINFVKKLLEINRSILSFKKKSTHTN